MSDKQELVMALAKLMVAAAWADREIAPAEINCLKDLLFQIPELNGRLWASLEIYMDSPVAEQERQRLLHELLERISTEEDGSLMSTSTWRMRSSTSLSGPFKTTGGSPTKRRRSSPKSPSLKRLGVWICFG